MPKKIIAKAKQKSRKKVTEKKSVSDLCNLLNQLNTRFFDQKKPAKIYPKECKPADVLNEIAEFLSGFGYRTAHIFASDVYEEIGEAIMSLETAATDISISTII